MAKANLKVYLDHHIQRDNLLYKTANDKTRAEEPVEQEKYLSIKHLYGEDSLSYLLRKPDFQRATWAWTPRDCVDLLESVLTEQVVPSVIMWLSPNNFQYVLDGGHRISVLLAWIKDDWGDGLPFEAYKDRILERDSKRAGEKVRELLRKASIGPFTEYLAAERRYKELIKQERTPDLEMDSTSLDYANLVRRWSGVRIGFPILWVKGDYKRAEDSFLKINRSGRQLSEWETKLVENRSSSFARAVMSIAQVSDAEHCWPKHDPEVVANGDLQDRINSILKKVVDLNELLFTPVYETPIKDLRQPLLATPYTKPEMKPAYVAEVLTIAEGKKGQKPETEALIKKDKDAWVSLIIKNGLTLVENAEDVLSNIYGPSPRSLALMPLVYFYNGQGVYVRSLLYGMLYWLNHGSETRDVLNRKLLFTIYRKAFEDVLLDSKEDIIRRIARRIGSGPEVTYPTARYYHGLLELVIHHEGKISTEEFKKEHEDLVEHLGKEKNHESDEEKESASRFYRGRMREAVHVRDLLRMFIHCEICGGRYYPGLFTEVDHKRMRSKGGKTTLSNARNTHPFCNNNREAIEALLGGAKTIDLPPFDNPEVLPKAEQLSFLPSFEEAESSNIEEPLEESALEESSGEDSDDAEDEN